MHLVTYHSLVHCFYWGSLRSTPATHHFNLGTALDHDVHQATLDDNHLAHRAPAKSVADLFVFQCHLPNSGVVGIGRDGNAAAQLAVLRQFVERRREALADLEVQLATMPTEPAQHAESLP